MDKEKDTNIVINTQVPVVPPKSNNKAISTKSKVTVKPKAKKRNSKPKKPVNSNVNNKAIINCFVYKHKNQLEVAPITLDGKVKSFAVQSYHSLNINHFAIPDIHKKLFAALNTKKALKDDLQYSFKDAFWQVGITAKKDVNSYHPVICYYDHKKHNVVIGLFRNKLAIMKILEKLKITITLQAKSYCEIAISDNCYEKTLKACNEIMALNYTA